MMREVLDGLDATRLMERTDRTGKSTTIASILLHASHHHGGAHGPSGLDYEDASSRRARRTLDQDTGPAGFSA
jgi:hypothetical protein